MSNREKNVALLQRLGSIPFSGFIFDEPDDMEPLCEATMTCLTVDDDGQIQGGDALWFMHRSMVKRYWELSEKRKSPDLRRSEVTEFGILDRYAYIYAVSVDEDQTVEAYINWKEAVREGGENANVR